jgi:hypothetical protein
LTKRLGRIKHSTLSKFQQPILELEYNQTPKKWCQAQMQATKKNAKQMQASRPGKRVVQENALKLQDRL